MLATAAVGGVWCSCATDIGPGAAFDRLGQVSPKVLFTTDGYFSSIHTYLHNILTIVVGLEFVRMLIDMTPGNTLEVLIVAIARQVIVSHDDPISNVCCVLCIAGLFATRHFLIPKNEMTIEMSEVEPDEEKKEN